jgi:hypothetical protein
VEGSVVPRDSPVFEDVRKPAWAQFEDIAPDAGGGRGLWRSSSVYERPPWTFAGAPFVE